MFFFFQVDWKNNFLMSLIIDCYNQQVFSPIQLLIGDEKCEDNNDYINRFEPRRLKKLQQYLKAVEGIFYFK